MKRHRYYYNSIDVTTVTKTKWRTFMITISAMMTITGFTEDLVYIYSAMISVILAWKRTEA